jgi:hypothetical protein
MFCYASLAAAPLPTKPKQKLFGNGTKYLPGFGGAPSTPVPPSTQPKKPSNAGKWVAGGLIALGVTLAWRSS